MVWGLLLLWYFSVVVIFFNNMLFGKLYLIVLSKGLINLLFVLSFFSGWWLMWFILFIR